MNDNNQSPYQEDNQVQNPAYNQESNQAYSQTAAQEPGKGKAVASLVCGIVGVVLIWAIGFMSLAGLGLGIIAIVLGVAARKELPPGQTGMATAGFVLGIIAVAAGAIVFLACVACVGAASLLGPF